MRLFFVDVQRTSFFKPVGVEQLTSKKTLPYFFFLLLLGRLIKFVSVV